VRLRVTIVTLAAFSMLVAGCSQAPSTSSEAPANPSDSAPAPVTDTSSETDAGTDAPAEEEFEYLWEWDAPAEMWLGTWASDKPDAIFPQVTLRADGTADLTRGRDGQTRSGTWTLAGGELTFEDSTGNIVINRVEWLAEDQWEYKYEGVYTRVE
jgi:hypothetical protein